MGTQEQHRPELEPLADPERVSALISQKLGAPRQAVHIVGQAKSGSSNVTLFINWGEERLVLRRPPNGPLLPTAHDVLREYRFLEALQGTDVPLPRPVLACDDLDVIGAPFYLMARVDGVLLQDGRPPELETPEARRQVCEKAIDTLAAIHAVNWRERGLTDRPERYLERQIKRWSRQLELTPTRGRIAGAERAAAWLTEHLPTSDERTIVHGDFGLHNMILGVNPPRVLAVLDWEMATIGDPLADLVWFLRGWGEWPSRNPANELPSLAGALTGEEMFARYEHVSGRTVHDMRFYEVFSMWKGAVILEGLYASYLEGNAANENVARFEWEVPESVAKLLTIID